MTKQIAALFLILCLVPGNFGYAQSAVGMIGVAAAVKGAVELTREGAVGKVVGSGESIFLKDEIKTDEKGSLQILLLDETTFTIGSNSILVIDKFVYDPATDAGQVNARVVKGTFRFISGKIAHKKPDDMQVALPAGTIGIRGTMVMGKVDGMKSLVVLTGPGAKNNAGSQLGEISVGNEGKSVRINTTGFGTEVDAGKSPTRPFQVPADKISEMAASLSPAGSGSGEDAGGEGSATDAAGQGLVDAGGDLSANEALGALSAAFAAETATASQNAAESSGGIQDGITTIQQLLSIQSGQFHFSAASIPLFNNGTQVGSYDYFLDLDFGARSIGGGHSRVNASPTNLGAASINFTLPTVSFANGSGSAVFTYPNLLDNSSSGCTSGSHCTGSLTATMFNSSGTIAAAGTVFLSVTNPSAVTDTGAGNTPRSDGLQPS